MLGVKWQPHIYIILYIVYTVYTYKYIISKHSITLLQQW